MYIRRQLLAQPGFHVCADNCFGYEWKMIYARIVANCAQIGKRGSISKLCLLTLPHPCKHAYVSIDLHQNIACTIPMPLEWIQTRMDTTKYICIDTLHEYHCRDTKNTTYMVMYTNANNM